MLNTKEQVEAWAKMARPSILLQSLIDTGLAYTIPEFDQIINIPQSRRWHAEGPVDVHTGLVCDEMAKICDREMLSERDRLVLMIAALSHDFGKAVTTVVDGEKINSLQHEKYSKILAEQFMRRCGFDEDIIAEVKALVYCHMRPNQISTLKGITKLKRDIQPSNLNHLYLLCEADSRGRQPSSDFAAQKQFLHEVDMQGSLSVGVRQSKLTKLITAADLKEAGIPPGPIYPVLLKEVDALHGEGVLTTKEDAVEYAKTRQMEEQNATNNPN